MTDPQRRHQRDILDDLRERGNEVKGIEDDLFVTREMVGELLLEGFSQHLEMNWMAEAAGISRQTAYKLLRKAQQHAAEQELSDKSDRLLDLGRAESRDEQEEAEYRRLLVDEDLNRWLDLGD